MEEIWKDIPHYEGRYQASNMGRIRSLDRRVKHIGGTALLKGRILKYGMDRDGYPLVVLSTNSNLKTYRVYRLVWLAFNGSIPEGMQVNHINEIKTDCRLENLNLMTRKENINWATGVRRSVRNRRKPVTQILPDGTEFRSFFSAQDAEIEIGISKANITNCCKGKRKSAGGFRWRYSDS